MNTRTHIDAVFEDFNFRTGRKPTYRKQSEMVPDTTPDTLYFSGEKFVTFILDREGDGAACGGHTHRNLRKAINAEIAEEDGLIDNGGDVEDVGCAGKIVYIDSNFDPGDERGYDADSYLDGRACAIWHDGKPVITFWNNLNDSKDWVDAAIDLCRKSMPSMPEDHRQYTVAAADWEGSYDELFPENWIDPRQMEFPFNDRAPLEQDVERRARVGVIRQQHILSPDVKQAMGIKPDYVKKGPSLRTRQAAMASESRA